MPSRLNEAEDVNLPARESLPLARSLRTADRLSEVGEREAVTDNRITRAVKRLDAAGARDQARKARELERVPDHTT
ncbi:MAG: hypothetical protein QOD35_3111 [Nocardioidaceae bacterium]|jgi:hypothetical protein|nr:hypothetical protein [Nocardioidaceae bacterium]